MKKITNFKKGFSLIEISIVLLIIGILISGILVGQDMILDAKIRSAQNLTKTSPVNKIPDLTLWLDVNAEKSLITTATADRCFLKYINYQDLLGNETICAWRDINSQRSLGANSSDKIALSINTTHPLTAMPTYVVNGIGGLPSLFFDGDDYLISSIPQETSVVNTLLNIDLLNLLSSNEVSFFIVQQFEGVSSGTSNTATLFHHSSGDFSIQNNHKVSISASNTFGPKVIFVSGTDSVLTTVKPTFLMTTPQIISFIRENGSAKLYVNSAAQIITNNTPNTSLNNSSSPISVGATITTSTSTSTTGTGTAAVTTTTTTATATANTYFKGKISEIIVFNRKISERERVQVENYLLQKYKIKKT
jgi:prepilin-type N-terminal cleavage/methylation domain-containing protein